MSDGAASEGAASDAGATAPARPLIVDAHTHFTPPGMLERIAETGDEPYWQFIMTPNGRNQTEQGFVDEARMLDDMDAAGVDRVFLLAGYQQSARGCREANDTVLGIAARHPDRVVPFLSISPADPGALDELRRGLELGGRGVGELNPYAQGVRLDSPELRALADACAEAGIPMTMHMSEETGRFYFGKSTPPLGHYYEFALRVPELKLVLAHWGGGLFFYELMPLVAAQLAHVSYDTAASPLLYPTERIFPVAAQVLAPGKFVYGSDYPLLIVRSHPEPSFAPFLAQLADAGVDDAEFFGAAALRLIDPAVPARRADAVSPRIAEEVAASRRLAERIELPLDPFMPVAAVAERWPAAGPVFERYGIPHRDSPVPVWEPIVQSAAARGLGAASQAALIEDLERAIGPEPA